MKLKDACSLEEKLWQTWVQSLSHIRLFATPGTAAYQASLSITKICSNSGPLSRWCHPTISSSFVHFSSCPQSLPTSGSFPVSWLFTSSGQSIGASASVLPGLNMQGWFSLGLTGLISLLFKGLQSLLQLGHVVVLFLVFKGISILFSIVAVSIYIPTNSARVFPPLHTLSSIYCL